MRNGSLWSRVVFKKEVIFHRFDFKTSNNLDFEVSKSSIWKHTTSCDKGVFSFIIISQLRRPIELKLSQVCYFMHTCWDTPTVKARQLPTVSSVFKPEILQKNFCWAKNENETSHIHGTCEIIFCQVNCTLRSIILLSCFCA